MLVLTTTWRHTNDSSFRRKSTKIRTASEEMPIVMIEYYFEGVPHEVEPKKTKKGIPIIPMCPSAKKKVKEVIRKNPSMGPKSVLVEAVGECSNLNYCEVPQSTNQVKDLLIHVFNSFKN